MRVTIDATSAYDSRRAGGIARYLIELTTELANMIARGETSDELVLAYRFSRSFKSGRRLALPGVRTRWIADPLWPLPWRRRSPTSVFHGGDARVPRWSGCARVATLHDVFSLLFDDFASPEFRARKRRAYLELADRCDRIVAVSGATRSDFLERIDFPPERVDVVHHGVDARFRPATAHEVERVRARHRLDGPYLFYVGELSRRKNLARLVRAFAHSGLAREATLALAGSPGFGYEELVLAIETEGLGSRLRLLGRVPDEDLPALYTGASAFACPSLYEGFGIPILEAAACGTSVLGGNVGAVPELAPPGAVLVDPLNEEAIVDGLHRVLDVPCADLESARHHAASFTWTRCARATRQVYSRALAGLA